MFLKGTRFFPRYINIELTNACNLYCSICPRQKMKREIGFMHRETLLKIANEIAPYGKRLLWLHLFGEPLLYLDLPWALSCIKERCSYAEVSLSTNCLSLNADIAEKLLDSNLDRVRLCIDTVDEEEYAKIRTGSDFARVINNIKHFLILKKEKGKKLPLVEIQYLRYRNDKLNKGKFIKFWKPLLIQDDKVHMQRFTTFASKVRCFSSAPVKRKRYPCLRLWNEVSIYYSGEVSACCYDVNGELIAGNLNKKSIGEIWNSQFFNALRQAHLKGDFSGFALCSQCLGLAQRTDERLP